MPWLTSFYFGNGRPGLKPMVDLAMDEIDAPVINAIPIGVDANGEAVVVRVGKYGPYLQRGEERGPLPPDIAPDELTIEQGDRTARGAQSSDRILGEDPETGLNVLLKSGRYGPYVQLGEYDAVGQEGGQAEDGVAVQDDDASTTSRSRKRSAVVPAAGCRRRPDRRPGDHGAERQVTARI